jgi:hypothetical protein
MECAFALSPGEDMTMTSHEMSKYVSGTRVHTSWPTQSVEEERALLLTRSPRSAMDINYKLVQAGWGR